MKKLSIILIFMVLICFSHSLAGSCGSNHHNTNNYHYDYDYNHYDYELTYNNDNSVVNTATTNIINNIDNTNLINEANHANISRESDTLFKSKFASTYGGVAIVPLGPDPNVIYVTSAQLYFNPSAVVAKLKPGEFSQFNINVTSDRPIVLRLSTNRTNIKIINSEIVINRNNGTAQAMILVTLEKGTYWTDGTVYFKSLTGETLGKLRIVFENAYGVDHISRVITDTNFTTIGHGVRQNRGTWGWEAFAAVKVDRNTNKETVYGVFTYDW